MIDLDSPIKAAHRDWERKYGLTWGDVRRRPRRTIYGMSMSAQHGSKGSSGTSSLRTSIFDRSSGMNSQNSGPIYSRAGRYAERMNQEKSELRLRRTEKT